MRFWTTDWSYNDFFNRLVNSANFAITEFSGVRKSALNARDATLHAKAFTGTPEK